MIATIIVASVIGYVGVGGLAYRSIEKFGGPVEDKERQTAVGLSLFWPLWVPICIVYVCVKPIYCLAAGIEPRAVLPEARVVSEEDSWP